MKINIVKEYQRFVENYDFNESLSLRTEKPHLARWAYGACEEWIKDFEASVVATETMDLHKHIIEGRTNILERLKQKLKTKFSNNKVLMEMLK